MSLVVWVIFGGCSIPQGTSTPEEPVEAAEVPPIRGEGGAPEGGIEPAAGEGASGGGGEAPSLDTGVEEAAGLEGELLEEAGYQGDDVEEGQGSEASAKQP